jgi:hypothetical protein
MSDIKSDWKKWNTCERISAIALIVTFVIFLASSIAGALAGEQTIGGGLSGIGNTTVQRSNKMTILPKGVSLTSRGFASLGLEQVAYVKPIVAGADPTYAIHAADGTRLAVVTDRLVAIAMVRQHDLEPASLH